QLYWLNREIEQDKKRLAELKTSATNCTAGEITGMPNGSRCMDKLGNYVAEIADLKALIELNIQKCWYELNRLNRYIQGVEDSEIRMILSSRYVNGLSWNTIANDLGYADESVPRKRHNRFLKMTEKSER
ncbi:MAG: hypothetical protein RSD63_10635, partial [Eubacterium sp.]